MNQMEKQEIIKAYKESKNKSQQIKILADLHVCTQKDIKEVLTEAGIDIEKRPYVRKAEVVTVNGKPQKVSCTGPVDAFAQQIIGGVPQIVEETLQEKIREMETINSNYWAEIEKLEQAIKDNENSIRVIKAYMEKEG